MYNLEARTNPVFTNRRTSGRHKHIEDVLATRLDNGGYNYKVFGTKVGSHGSSFFAGVVVLHELAHYGRYWNFMPNKYIENNKYYEAGQPFERWSFLSIQNYEGTIKSAVENGW